jgi:hypothetical protein
MKSVSFRNLILGATAFCLTCALASCGSSANSTNSNPSGGGVIGAYSDSSGNFALDVRSGGAATYTSVGATFSCTYTTAGDKLTLSCQGQTAKTVFTIHDDGSLTAQNSVAGTLRRTK